MNMAIVDSKVITVDSNTQFDRRAFMRMIGVISLPLAAEGCADESTDVQGVERFRAVNPPATAPVSVLQAKTTQTIVTRSEELSIDKDLDWMLRVGDQCRIRRTDGHVALYTVGEVRPETGTDKVRMGLEARKRLATTTNFAATLDTKVVADLTDAEAEAQGEFVERLVDDGSSTSLIALAPHGGWIEQYTDDQAALVQAMLAGKGASSWICKGYKQGGGSFDRWHITSSALSRNSFPGLDAVADRGFAYSVSFHGMAQELVLVGGSAPYEIKQMVRSAIAAVVEGSGCEVSVATAADLYAGDSPSNVTNWLTAGGAGGVQIEQCFRVRSVFGLDIAAAVAGVFDQLI